MQMHHHLIDSNKNMPTYHLIDSNKNMPTYHLIDSNKNMPTYRPKSLGTKGTKDEGLSKMQVHVGIIASQPILPVPGFPLAVGDGYDAHSGRFVQIHDGKREAPQYEPLGSMHILWPALRPLGNRLKSIIDSRQKPDTCLGAALSVPIVGSLQFQPSLRIEAVRLIFRHPQAAPPGGGAPLRRGSSGFCQIECRRCGA